MVPDPAQSAMSIAKGEPYSFVPLVHHIDEALNSPSAQPWLQDFKTGLKSMGVTSSNVGQASKDMLRMMMFNNLTQSAASQAMSGSSRQLTQ